MGGGRWMGSASKVAIVTGAGTGGGRAVSLALRKEGYSVALAGRRKAPLDVTARAAPASESRTLIVPTDVTDPSSVKRLFAETNEVFGRLRSEERRVGKEVEDGVGAGSIEKKKGEG